LVQSLNGRQRQAVGVDCSDVPVVLADVEGSVKILRPSCFIAELYFCVLRILVRKSRSRCCVFWKSHTLSAAGPVFREKTLLFGKF
jgi:hypothetical protein